MFLLRKRPAFWARLILILPLAACRVGEKKESPSAAPPDSIAFVEMASSGLRFNHQAGARGAYSMRESIGSGGALLDYDNDGDLDVYLVSGEASDTAAPNAAGAGRNRLFRQDSAWKFTDVSEAAGAPGKGYGMGASAGDLDNDGDVDLFVTQYGGDLVYRNRGDGTFEDATRASGLHEDLWSTAAVLTDFDRDGFLDIFVGRYGKDDPDQVCHDAAGRRDYCGPESLAPLPAALFRNRRDGTFEDVSLKSGIASRTGKALGAVALDFDGNGYPDLYVSNDGLPNHLWLNQGNGTFRESALAFGVAVNALGKAEAGMGIAVGDADGDGRPDLYITHLRTEFNKLYRSSGGHGYVDDTQASGAAVGSQPMTGWGTGFFDYDNDGDADLAVVDGRVTRWNRQVEGDSYWGDYAEPGLLYENLGQGRFRGASSRSSAFRDRVENSRGLLLGDFDGDGGVDFLVANEGGPARLFRNEVAGRGHWISLAPFDPALKRLAYGAELEVKAGGRRWTATCQPAYGYLASQDPRVHFGLGGLARVEEARVRWPDGKLETFRDLAADALHTLVKGKGVPAEPAPPRP